MIFYIEVLRQSTENLLKRAGLGKVAGYNKTFLKIAFLYKEIEGKSNLFMMAKKIPKPS